MPPRPNDKGRTSTPPETSVARQSSQSYDISSPDEEDDDFIGNDSYDGSPEGSWDSSGNGGGNSREQGQDGDRGQSSPGESLDDDDGFIGQDTSSGGDDYDGEYLGPYSDQGRADTEHAGDDYEQDEEFRNSEVEIEGDDDAQSALPTSDLSVQPATSESAAAPHSHPSYVPSLTSGSAGERYEDDSVDDAEGAKAPQDRQKINEDDTYKLSGAAVEQDYSFESEEDADVQKKHVAFAKGDVGDIMKPAEAQKQTTGFFKVPMKDEEGDEDEEEHDMTSGTDRADTDAATRSEYGGSDARPGAAPNAGGREPSRGSSATSLDAENYMQSRLSAHLLAVDSSDAEDSTPRLPPLSEREQEREQEQELLLLKAKEASNVLIMSAPDDDDDATPRLPVRDIPPAQDREAEEATPRMISTQGQDTRTQALVCDSVQSSMEVHGDASAGWEIESNNVSAGQSEIVEKSVDDNLEDVVISLVSQAITDAGGCVSDEFMSKPKALECLPPQNMHTSSADAEEQMVATIAADPEENKMMEGQSNEETPAAPTKQAAPVSEELPTSIVEAAEEADGTGTVSEISRQQQPSDAPRGHAQENMTEQESNKSAPVGRATTPDTPDMVQVNGAEPQHMQTDEDLQTNVIADVYLSAETLEGADTGNPFMSYSTKGDGDNGTATRPLSRGSSRGRSISLDRPKTQGQRMRLEPTQQTRMQMRNAERELSSETSQGLRQRSANISVKNTSSHEDLFMGRPDWNFETVKFPRSHKEKFRYQPPPVVSDSKWMRNRPVSREPSKTADENKSFESLRHSSRGSVSWEDSDIDPESSRMSVTARAKEYWVNNVRTPERHKKSTHRHQQRPGTSMSTLGSDSMAFDSEDEIGTSRRPETSEGFATRFRYNVQGVRGGTFGNGARKDDVDWKIYDAKTKPGVGQYNVVREDSTPINGGKMLDTFDAVGSANWEARRKSRLPAPGQYDRDVNLPVTAIGGRFAEGNRWQETEVFEQRSRELPGPVEYDAGYSRDKAYKRVNGGLISDAKVMSELDWTLLRGSRTPGPSTYELPAVDKANARQRAKGGKVGRAPRLKPIYTTAADSPGPGSYFSQSHTEVQKEVSVRRTNSRNSVAHSLSRASLGREKSLEMKGPNRKTYLDDMQRKTSKLPGPASYNVDGHTVSKKTSQQPLDCTAIISRPGTSDPVVYSVGHTERSSIVSDYRTMQSLHRSWADSANEFKSLLDSFITSESSRVKFNDKAEISDLLPVQYTMSEDYLAINSPLSDAAVVQDSVFLTQQI